MRVKQMEAYRLPLQARLGRGRRCISTNGVGMHGEAVAKVTANYPIRQVEIAVWYGVINYPVKQAQISGKELHI